MEVTLQIAFYFLLIIYFSASSVIYNRTFDYSAQTGPSVISSESTNVCFCDDNKTINCSQTQLLTMTAYPGEEIYISVVTVGQLDGVSPGILQIRPLDNTGDIGLYNTSAKECTTIALKPIYKSYRLNVLGTDFLLTFKILNISLSDCPLGFELSNETRSCDCDKLRQEATAVTCDVTSKHMTRGGGTWIGNISDCVIVQTPQNSMSF